MFTWYRAGVALAAMLAVSSAAPAADKAPDCHLKELASIDLVTLPSGQYAVPVILNGQKDNLLLDTSVGYSQLDRSTISELWLRAYGGAYRVAKFQMGGSGPFEMYFDPAPVGTFPKGVVGTLGMAFLRNFDLELDPQRNKLNLFSPQHCPGQVIYWSSGPYTRVALEKPSYPFYYPSSGLSVWGYWNAPHVPVVLDGKSFSALLNTTTGESLIEKTPAQQAFGFSNQRFALTKSTAISGHDTYEHSFKSLSFGGVTISDPHMRVIESDLHSDIADAPITIGLNILRRLHLYIASKEGFLYITAADAH